MEQYGLCKIECTPEQRDAAIAFHQWLLKQQEECERRINSHDFHITKVNKFLFFKSRSTILDTVRVEAEYMVSMLMTKGDVYLTPEQCGIFRSAAVKGGE
jgi:hypothetical protein